MLERATNGWLPLLSKRSSSLIPSAVSQTISCREDKSRLCINRSTNACPSWVVDDPASNIFSALGHQKISNFKFLQCNSRALLPSFFSELLIWSRLTADFILFRLFLHGCFAFLSSLFLYLDSILTDRTRNIDPQFCPRSLLSSSGTHWWGLCFRSRKNLSAGRNMKGFLMMQFELMMKS